MLNKSVDSGHPCLDLREVFELFTIEYDVSYGLILHSLYYIEVHSFYTHIVESFHHEWTLNFVKCFFCIIEMITCKDLRSIAWQVVRTQ